MRRHSSLIPLSRFHKRILFAAQLAKKNSPPYPGYPKDAEGKREYILAFYENDLQAHFEKEEKELLPLLGHRSPELKRLSLEIIKEHSDIRQKMGILKTDQNPETCLDELGKLLEMHVRKEERQFFQLIQEVLSEKELLQIKL